MSFVAFLAHLCSAWFAFILPCFASYKALKHRPISEPELERWVMYWTVLGALIAVEYTAEWVVSWFPFYWETKTLFLLFLSLPQTQGSTYIYKSYLEPFFQAHEADIDSGIQAAQTNILTFLQNRLHVLWDLLVTIINKAPPPSGQQPADGQAAPGGNPVALAQNLWRTYGPMVTGIINQASRATVPAIGAQQPPFTSTTSYQLSQSSPSLVQRPSDYVVPEARVPLPLTPDGRSFSEAPPPFPVPEFH